MPKLNEVTIEPATGNHCDSIKIGDARLGKDSGEEGANYTTDSVDCEDLEYGQAHHERRSHL